MAPDLALVAGALQIVAVPAALFLPSIEECLYLLRYPPILAGCIYAPILDMHGLSFNGPVVGLVALLIAGLMLVAVGRGHKPAVQLQWLWIALALDVAGLVLAWMVAPWFLPMAACAVWAAVALGRGQTRH